MHYLFPILGAIPFSSSLSSLHFSVSLLHLHLPPFVFFPYSLFPLPATYFLCLGCALHLPPICLFHANQRWRTLSFSYVFSEFSTLFIFFFFLACLFSLLFLSICRSSNSVLRILDMDQTLRGKCCHEMNLKILERKMLS